MPPNITSVVVIESRNLHPLSRSRTLSSVISVIEFLGRVANAANYGSLDQTARVRLSRTSAGLVGFYIFHALPNGLLLSREGRRLYSYYCHINTNSVPTRLVEIFLGGALLLHAFLGIRKSLSTVKTPLHRNSLFLTGGLISGLISMHLMDFRFTPFVPKVDKQVLDLVNKTKRSKNLLYWLFVLSVAFHAFKGVSSPAWVWRLGFKGKREIQVVRRLSQALIIVSTFLYLIPLTMDNPYGNTDSDSPRNSDIIIVRSKK